MTIMRLRGESTSSLRPPSADMRRYSDSGGAHYRRVPSLRGIVSYLIYKKIYQKLKMFEIPKMTKKF